MTQINANKRKNEDRRVGLEDSRKSKQEKRKNSRRNKHDNMVFYICSSLSLFILIIWSLLVIVREM